jgi:hypothetical protein
VGGQDLRTDVRIDQGDPFMRHALRLFVPLLLPVMVFAQTIYKVPADTKGNTIVLTIANESATAPAGLLTVRPVGTRAGVSITPGSITIKHLAGNAAAGADV